MSPYDRASAGKRDLRMALALRYREIQTARRSKPTQAPQKLGRFHSTLFRTDVSDNQEPVSRVGVPVGVCGAHVADSPKTSAKLARSAASTTGIIAAMPRSASEVTPC